MTFVSDASASIASVHDTTRHSGSTSFEPGSFQALTRDTDNAIEAHGQYEYLGSPPFFLYSDDIDDFDICSLLNPDISTHFSNLHSNPFELFANPSIAVRGDDINHISSSTKALSADSLSIVSVDDSSNSSGDSINSKDVSNIDNDSFLADLFMCESVEEIRYEASERTLCQNKVMEP